MSFTAPGGTMTASPPSRANTSPPDHAIAPLLRSIQGQLTDIQQRIDRLESLATEGKAMSGAAIEFFDDQATQWQQKNVDVEARVALLHELAETLTRPSVLQHLLALTRQTDQLNTFLQMLHELPGIAATSIDIFDSMMDQATKRGLDIDARLRALATAGEHLSSPAAIATLEALFGDGSTQDPPPQRLENPILQLLVDASDALREAIEQPAERTGLFGLLRAGRNREVQTFTAFSLRLARSLGKRLQATDNMHVVEYQTASKNLPE